MLAGKGEAGRLTSATARARFFNARISAIIAAAGADRAR